MNILMNRALDAESKLDFISAVISSGMSGLSLAPATHGKSIFLKFFGITVQCLKELKRHYWPGWQAEVS